MGIIIELPDISRIMARLLLKIEKWGLDHSETLPFSKGERRFSDLLSHADKIEDEDDYGRKIFNQLIDVIPQAVKTWNFFKEIYGRLLINSFEVSGEEDEKLGWALYLGPSIMDHSCVPNAEVNFRGKKIIVKSKVTSTHIDLRKIFISYIDITASTTQRRQKLRKYYHFDCICQRCLGIKYSWVTGEPFNPQLGEVLAHKKCVVEAIKKEAKGKEREFLESLRCQKCSGRPVALTVEQDQMETKCSYCNEIVGTETLEEYNEIKRAVDTVLAMEQIPCDAAPQCVELMTGLFHPYNLTYLACCQVAVTDCILQNRLQEALEFADILLGVTRRLAKGSTAQVDLIIRMMRLQAEIGSKESLDQLVQSGLVDAYTNTVHCTQILKFRDKMYETFFRK